MAGTLQLPGLDHLPPRALRGRVHLAVGMFDGVHLGHRAVIESAVASARREGGSAAVLTFDPHPSRLFRPEAPVSLIHTAATRTSLLAALGPDAVIVQPFDPAFAAIEAAEFVPRLQAALPHLARIYVGENWRFGRGRVGDVASLVGWARARGLSVFSAERVSLDGEPVSSTRIRTALVEGRVDDAGAMLGYSYFAQGAVTPGRRLGRTIGFPTLNLAWRPELSPRFGVYAVRVRPVDAPGPVLGGVANFGLRPTVGDGAEARLEVHVLGGQCPWGEGSLLHVDWLRFLRPEQTFPGLDALRVQIAADAAAAAAWLDAG
jgi:riboflavin kinase / FMN adenylyltransferase